ncbi:MAG: nitroreductase family protein [Dehalococcoidales bacterium]|nr:nitroreductase family protein [Dehalococcoidales bacterium]
MFRDLVMKCRSYRRFYQDVPIDKGTLIELIDLARNSASGSNRQPLKYILSCSKENNALIFPCLRWAAALKDWSGPVEGEHPSGYIIIMGDKEISTNFGLDPGIAAQTILLGAVEKGLGGCMLASVEKEKLRQLFNIAARYEILLVIALGKPKEKVVLDVMGPADPFVYWRDKENVHHVPKRRLDDIIIAQL